MRDMPQDWYSRSCLSSFSSSYFLYSLGRHERGEEDPNAAGAKERYERLQRSIGAGRPLQNVSNLPNPLGPATSIQELETLRTASQKGNWTIFVTPRRGKSLDGQLGNATFIMDGSTPMQCKSFSLYCAVVMILSLPAALVRIVEHFSLQWVRMEGHALDLKPLSLPSHHVSVSFSPFPFRDDCSLRFAGNITMDAATEDMTIQEVYTAYQKRPDRALVVNDAKKNKLPKGSSMAWELAINAPRVSY